MRLITAFFVYAMLSASAIAQVAEGESISGEARAMDADILAIGRQRVILWGVDAPERNQVCELKRREWACWNIAARTLQLLIEHGPVTCESKGVADRFGRIYGVCTADGKNVNEELIRSGMALAFREQTEDYAADEEAAKDAKAGLWQDTVKFVEPWVWRRTRGTRGAR